MTRFPSGALSAGSTALVTGGTSGIGAAFARALAARGLDLVLVARDADRLRREADGLMDTYGVDVETISADLSEHKDVQRVVERLEESARPVDALVNNAGFGVHTSLLSEHTATHEAALDVMCRAVLVLGAAAGRTMRERGRGAIVNVSSAAGFVTMGSYSAVKAWVTSYSEGLAIELAGSGVSVTAVCPGWVRTEFHQRAGISTRPIPSALWLDADAVVAECLADADRGAVLSIPSRRYRILMAAARHVPRPLLRAVSARLSSGRREPVRREGRETGEGRS